MDYIYQELDPAQAQAFEAALDKCPECKEKLEAFQRTRAAMRELDDLAPPASVSQLLLEEAARAAPTKKISFGERLRRLMRVFVMHPAIAAAATLVVVLGVSFVAYRKGLPPAHRAPTADSPLPATPPAAAGAEPRSAAAGVGDEQKASSSPLKQQAQQARSQTKTATTGANAPQGASASPDNAGALRAGAAAQPNADSNQQGAYRAAGPVAKDAPGSGGGGAKLDSLRKTGKLGGLKSKDLRDGFGKANRGIVSKNKGADKAVGETTNTLRTRRRARRRRSKPASQRRLYRRTRGRAANVLDVGGGSSGVWGGRSRYRYQQKPKAAPSQSGASGGDDDRDRARAQAPAPAAKAPVQLATPKKPWKRAPAEAGRSSKGYTKRRYKRRPRARRPARRSARNAPPATQTRRADQKRVRTEREKKVKKKKDRDPVVRLLAEGTRAVKRGDCQTAFARFNEAMRRRPYVIGTISSRVGSCYGTLLKSKRYRVLAQRISSARNPRQYRSKKRAAPRRAAPTKPAKK